MRLLRKNITCSLLTGCVLTAFVAHSSAQTDSQGWVAKADWQQRVLKKGRTDRSNAFDNVFSDAQPKYRTTRSPSSRQGSVRTISTLAEAEQQPVFNAEELIPTPEPMGAGGEAYDPMRDFEVSESQPSAAYGSEPVFGCGGEGCGGCFDGGDGCGDCGGWYEGTHRGFFPGLGMLLGRLRCSWLARDMVIVGGVHGFKGPTDLGRNGNFGLHTGINMGAPLGYFPGVGYQLGFLAVRSNFSGHWALAAARPEDRNQFFFTAGLFRRKMHGGLQWGVAFDLLRDRYYSKASLTQVRTETGYLWPGGRHEVGYFGAYGIDGDEMTFNAQTRLLDPTDMFAIYYRRHFDAGGEGRFWSGVTGKGDAIVGADMTVPLGRNWSLENRMNYLIPNEGRGVGGGPEEESWGLTMHMVFHLGQPARNGLQSPYRPVLSVADNTLFMNDATAP